MKTLLLVLLVFFSLIDENLFSVRVPGMTLSPMRVITLILVIRILYNEIKSGNIKSRNKIMGLPVCFMMMWVIYSFMTLFWSKNITSGISDIIILITSSVIFIVLIYNVTNSMVMMRLVHAFTITAILHNIIGWYEILSKNYIFAPPEYISYYSFRGFPVSMFYNTNNYATFLLISSFFLFISFLNSRTLFLKIIFILSMISDISLIYLTSSRGNLIGVFLGFIAILILKLRKKFGARKFFSLMYTLISLLIIIFFAVGLMHARTLFADVGTGESDLVRTNLIKNGIEFLIQTNFFGVGVGSLEVWMLNNWVYPTFGVLLMHNWWIEILTKFGVGILIFYLFVYFNLLYNFGKNVVKQDNKVEENISIGLFGALVGFIIGGVSPSTVFNANWMWIFIAICVAWRAQIMISKEKKND